MAGGATRQSSNHQFNPHTDQVAFCQTPWSQVIWSQGGWSWSDEPANERPSFFVPHFDLKTESPWILPQRVEVMDLESIQKGLRSLQLEAARGAERWAWYPPKKAEFLETLSKIQDKFSRDELKKAVPWVFETTPHAPTVEQSLAILENIFENQGPLYRYGYWGGGFGLLGVTPEILFSWDGSSELKTMALAGTASLTSDLLADPKERHEHQLVVDDVIQKLTPEGEVTVEETVEWPIGKIKHLKTEIHLKSSTAKTFKDWVEKLHPTAALGAFPNPAGAKWLKDEAQKRPRWHFGAPFGVRFPDDSGFTLVGIRNIQWRDGITYLGSGCGVVPASDPDKEWEELRLKRRFVKEILGL